MADSRPNPETSTAPRGANRGRGRGNRGPQHNRTPSSDQDFSDHRGRGGSPGGGRGARGGRGGRGRGRGRGGDSMATTTFSPQSTAETSSGRPPGGGFGARLTEAASEPQGDSKDPDSQDARAAGQPATNEDAEVCFICASPIEHVSIAPCNHQTCHICSLRLRALYKTRACAHCRVSYSFIVEYEEVADNIF